MTDEYFAPRSDSEMKEDFEQRRRGVTAAESQVATELRNISDALLEVLKHLRMMKNKMGK